MKQKHLEAFQWQLCNSWTAFALWHWILENQRNEAMLPAVSGVKFLLGPGFHTGWMIESSNKEGRILLGCPRKLVNG